MISKGLLFILFTTLVTFHSTASAWAWRFDPYAGADMQWRRTDYKGGFGDNIFAHTYPQANGYVGLKFCDDLALEAGYEAGESKTRQATLTTGDIAAGTPITSAFSPTVFKSTAKFQGPHLDLVGYYSPCPESDLKVIGSIGAARIKGTFERRTIQIAGNISMNTVRTLNVQKTVLRLGGGLQYMLDCHWGIRGMVGWENLSNMVANANDGAAGQFIPEVKPKNSVNYSIGILWAY